MLSSSHNSDITRLITINCNDITINKMKSGPSQFIFQENSQGGIFSYPCFVLIEKISISSKN